MTLPTYLIISSYISYPYNIVLLVLNYFKIVKICQNLATKRLVNSNISDRFFMAAVSKYFLSQRHYFLCSKQELQFYVDIITASKAGGCSKCDSQDFTSNKHQPRGFLALFLLQRLFCFAIMHLHKHFFIPSIPSWELSEHTYSLQPYNSGKMNSLFL